MFLSKTDVVGKVVGSNLEAILLRTVTHLHKSSNRFGNWNYVMQYAQCQMIFLNVQFISNILGRSYSMTIFFTLFSMKIGSNIYIGHHVGNL